MGKWLDHRRDARRPPPAPTLGTTNTLNHTPDAIWSGYNPNTGVYTPPPAYGSGSTYNRSAAQNYQQRRNEQTTARYSGWMHGQSGLTADQRAAGLTESGSVASRIANEQRLAPNGPLGPLGPAGPAGAARDSGVSVGYGAPAMAPPSAAGQPTVGGYTNGTMNGSAGPVAMAGVRGDADGLAAARAALAQMQERSQSGWSQLDRMALDQAQRQAGMYEQAQRGAVMNDAARRGMRGSGLQMLGALQAQQSGADRALDAATNLGIAGRDRAMMNTSQAAALGMGINDTQFNQAATRAAAVDAFNAMSSGRADAAAASNYQNQLAAFQLQQQMQQQRMQNIMGPIFGLAQTGIGLASGGTGGGG